MADVFVSYKRDQRSVVEALSGKLRDLGLSVWFDASLSAGEAFSDEIDREARAAKCILVCWSPEARESRWVRAEAMIGFDQDKLAAAYVAGPDGFYAPAPFNTIHVEDLRAWLEAQDETYSGWRGLLRRVGRLAGRGDLEAWGALNTQATERELRAWLSSHPDSPILDAAKAMLQARLRQNAECARRESEARARREGEDAERERQLELERRAEALRQSARREADRQEDARHVELEALTNRQTQRVLRIGLVVGVGAVIVFALTLGPSLIRSAAPATTVAHINSADFQHSNSVSPAPLLGAAPEILIEDGACPGEGCEWGQRWRARYDIQSFQAPPETLGTTERDLIAATLIREDTWSTPLTARMIARRFNVTVTRGAEASPYNPAISPGQVIAHYYYLGEGCYRAWIARQFWSLCETPLEGGSVQEELWVQVRLSDGSLVWVRPHDESFISQDGLDTDLAETLANDWPLNQKLDQVDRLIAEGADIHGDGGLYGFAPSDGVVASQDPRVLRAMLSRELDLSRGCPAHEATRHANKDRFDVMLDALFVNGMTVSCINRGEPAVTSFLTFGIETNDYSVPNAIRITRVLASHGVPINAADEQGRTIFDTIAAVRNNPARLTPLREELERLATAQRGTQ